jgi:hypothetical protein
MAIDFFSSAPTAELLMLILLVAAQKVAVSVAEIFLQCLSWGIFPFNPHLATADEKRILSAV